MEITKELALFTALINKLSTPENHFKKQKETTPFSFANLGL